MKYPSSGSCVPAALLAAVVGCGDGSTPPPPPPPPDTTAPVVTILHPADAPNEGSAIFDEDGDGLLDLRVSWSDTESGVDPATVQVTGRMAQTASITDGDNLVTAWTVGEITDSSLVLHETIDALLRGGNAAAALGQDNRIIVSVLDSAGNMGADTIVLPIPHANLHRIIPTGMSGGFSADMVVCPDDLRLYQIYGRSILVYDTQSFQMIGSFFNPAASDNYARMLCIPGDPMVYATSRVERFNRSTLAWDSRVQGSLGSKGIVASRADTAIIYVGEITTAAPARIDRIANVRLGEVGLPWSQFVDSAFGLEILDADSKIYVARSIEPGLIVGDPSTGAELGRINLDPANGGNSTADNIVLSPGGQLLYAAPNEGSFRGLVEIDTQTDQITRFIESIWTPSDVAINASGTRLWLTHLDGPGNIPAQSWLIDLTSTVQWSLIAQLDRPVPPGQTTWVLAAAFHPNGRLLFQARDDDVDVYLIRE